jgi:Cell division protein
MANKKKNSAPSYFDLQFLTSTISTMLVLLLLGLVVFFVLAAGNLSVYVRENMTFSLLISDEMKEADILIMQSKFNREPFVKESVYISKEQALKEYTESMGTDPKEFLGYNPFKASIEIKLNSNYINSDSIANIERVVKRNANIEEVSYRKELIDTVNENMRNISIALLVFAVVLTLISFVLINNTIKLTIYSKRFLIHTMKLVGASWGFIRKPFIWKNIWGGVLAALLANAILISAAYWLISYEQDLLKVISLDIMLLVVIAVFVSGIIITFLCAYFSINRYLRMKTKTLYYI